MDGPRKLRNRYSLAQAQRTGLACEGREWFAKTTWRTLQAIDRLAQSTQEIFATTFLRSLLLKTANRLGDGLRESDVGCSPFPEEVMAISSFAWLFLFDRSPPTRPEAAVPAPSGRFPYIFANLPR